MAFMTTDSNESIRKIILILIALPLVASSNIDCDGKAFHCVNSTHFMICVDLGGGVSSTIDGFIIPCPPSTECQRTNYFECEYPRSTSVSPIVETSVPSDLTQSEITTVTDTTIIFTSANRIIDEVKSTDINFNTVSITTLQENSITINETVTESVVVERTATNDYTNIENALITAPHDFTTNTNTIDTSTLTSGDIEYSVTETFTPLYQETVAIDIIDNTAVTTDPYILENIRATDKLLLDNSTAITINEKVPDQNASQTVETSTLVYQDTVAMLISDNVTVTTEQNTLEIIRATDNLLLDESAAITINETVPHQNAPTTPDTSTPLYQDTVAIDIIINTAVITDSHILENIGATNKSFLDNSAAIAINETVPDQNAPKAVETSTLVYQDTVAMWTTDNVIITTETNTLEITGATAKILLDNSAVIKINETVPHQNALKTPDVSTPLYQETVAIDIIDNIAVTTDPFILENITAADKLLVNSAAITINEKVPDQNASQTVETSTPVYQNTVAMLITDIVTVTTEPNISKITGATAEFLLDDSAVITMNETVPHQNAPKTPDISTPLYQDTVALGIITKTAVTTDSYILEIIGATTDKSSLDYSAAITISETAPDQNALNTTGTSTSLYQDTITMLKLNNDVTNSIVTTINETVPFQNATKTPETSTSVYQDTVAMLITYNVTVTTETNTLEYTGATAKILLNDSAVITINEKIPDQNAPKTPDISTPLNHDTVAIGIINNTVVTSDPHILENNGATDKSLLDNSSTINETVPDKNAPKAVETSTPVYQDTAVAMSITDNVTVTTDQNIVEIIGATDNRRTDTVKVNDSFNSFTTEKDTITNNVFLSSTVENNFFIGDITFNTVQYETTTEEIIDTTVGTTITVANIDITSTDTVTTETFTEKYTTALNQLLNDKQPGFITENLTEITVENTNISDVFVTPDRLLRYDSFSDLTSEISVTEQYEASREPTKNISNTKISPNIVNIRNMNVSKFDNADTSSLPFFDNSAIKNNVENITTDAGTTYDTTNTNTFTHDHQTTDSILEAITITNNKNNIEHTNSSTSNIDTTMSSILTVNTANILNQEKRTHTLDGLSTKKPEDTTTSVSVSEPLTSLSKFVINETNNEKPLTLFNIESSTNNITNANILPIITTQTLNNHHTIPTEDKISSLDVLAVNNSNAKEITISEVNTINSMSTGLDLEKTIHVGTSNKSSVDAEVKDAMLSTERNEKIYSFTGVTEGTLDVIVSIAPTLSGNEIIDQAKEATVDQNSTKSIDIKTKSNTTQNVFKQNTLLLNVTDSSKNSTNPRIVIESHKMSVTSPTVKGINNSLSVNAQDQTLIAVVTSTPVEISQDISTIDFYQESTSNPNVANLEVTIVGDNYISITDMNVFDSKVEKSTEINNLGQKLNDIILKSATGLNYTLQDNVTAGAFENKIFSVNNFSTTEGSLISNNNYQEESVTSEITQKFAKYDSINQKEDDIAVTLESQVFTSNLDQTSTHTGANEIVSKERTIHALPLNTDTIISTTQEYNVNSEILHTTSTMNPSLKTYNDKDLLKTDLNKSTPNTVFLQNNILFKPNAKVTTQSIQNQKNNNRLFSEVETLLTLTESTTDSPNIGKSDENVYLKTETLNTNIMVEDVIFSANNRSKDISTALYYVDDALVVGSTLNENMKTVDSKKEASTTRNITTAEASMKNTSNNDGMKDDVNSNLQFQSHNSFKTNNKEIILDKITTLSELLGLDQGLHQNAETSFINTFNNTGVYFNETKVKSTFNNVSLNYATVLDENFAPNAATSETDTNNNRDVSVVDSQATLMPNDGFLRQPSVIDQTLSQNAEVNGTNNLSKILVTNTVNKTEMPSINTRTTVIPNESSLKHLLTYDEKLVQNKDMKFSRSDGKTEDENDEVQNTNLRIDSTLAEFPKENDEKEQKILQQSTAGVHTTGELITTITTESPVNQKSITNSTKGFVTSQIVINLFCFNRNRGRYADREDCTKFYICIGKTEPILGKCPENTVFSEIKKQCTKNKSHCVRENEFKCLSEGRFSDVLTNNAYYICVKRRNSFIRFKFQCQNGHFLNKITVRCTKQLETVNQSSTSVDNSNSEKSEGISTQETNKSKNNKDSHKESKSSEEFECKKEGKFAHPENCRKFYVCTKTKKSEFRMRRRSCDSDEVFHKDKKKCVDDDSYEC